MNKSDKQIAAFVCGVLVVILGLVLWFILAVKPDWTWGVGL